MFQTMFQMNVATQIPNRSNTYIHTLFKCSLFVKIILNLVCRLGHKSCKKIIMNTLIIIIINIKSSVSARRHLTHTSTALYNHRQGEKKKTILNPLLVFLNSKRMRVFIKSPSPQIIYLIMYFCVYYFFYYLSEEQATVCF